ncbi:inositol 1,4,5-trisphosphate-gated calcium channel ITPR2-like, partial [Saccoglossus kowalevskii]
MVDSLRIGDIIPLYSENERGYVFTDISSHAHNILHVYPEKDNKEHKGNKRTFLNPQVATFQVCVQHRYQAQKKYRDQASKFLGYLLKKKGEQVENLPELKRLSEKEMSENEKEQARQLHTPVKYGQIIQLKHVFTKKYIHVSTTHTSNTEHSNMRVELLDHHAKKAQFRIMPRYKVKSEGDTVQVDDQIILVSVKTAGHHLHVSNARLGQDFINSDSFELNLSVRMSGFSIQRYYKPNVHHENIVKGGTVFRLFHKELEAYLTAGEVDEDVLLRVRVTDPRRPRTLSPSTSAITYWQIEAAEGIMTGEVMRWKQPCRLRHLTTHKYLSLVVKGSGVEVTVTDDASGPDTIFKFHPVVHDTEEIKEVKGIQFESYASIEHVSTKKWLHGDCGIRQYNKVEKGDSDSMSNLQWSKATLRKITARENKLQFDDAFTIQKVDTDLIEIFNFVAGMVPVLQKIVKDNKIPNKKQAKKITDALQELNRFMNVNGEYIKDRQKLLRNLKVVDLLVDVTKLSYKKENEKHKRMADIIIMCYEVLYTYVCGDSRKNELYLARFIDYFQGQLKQTSVGNVFTEQNVGHVVTRMLMELFRDNRKIVDRITKQHITQYIDLLEESKTSSLEPGPRKGNQSCLYFTEVGSAIGKTDDDMYISTDNGKTWIPLSGDSKEHHIFLEHQLDLFGKLSQGRNENVIEKITDKFTFQKAYLSLKNDKLPATLRAKYCELIKNLFIDVGQNVPVFDRPKLLFVWDELKKSCSSVAESHRIQFKDLAVLINAILKEKSDHRVLQLQVLRLVYTLVKFGYYTDKDDIKDFVESLKIVVNTNDDSEVFEKSFKTKSLVDVKHITAVEKLREIFKDTSYFKEDVLSKTLMTLSNYKYDKMLQMSMHLLYIQYSSYSRLFSRAIETQVLLKGTSVSVFRECENKMPVLRRLSATKMNTNQFKELEDILDTFTGFCSLEDEPEERHPMNQIILYNCGILSDIFEIFSQETNDKLKSANGYKESLQQIFKKCFILLRVLARGNTDVQMRLFERLDILLNLNCAGEEMAKAIKEVEEHDLTIKRNQICVMKVFMQSENVPIIKDETSRNKLLDTKENNPDLYMISLVDLLATCAEGENTYIESICQKFFSLDDLLSILTKQNNYKIKRAFARFMVWVYMNTASSSDAECFLHNEDFWKLLETTIDEIDELTKYMKENETKVKRQLKKLPAKVDTTEDGRNHALLHYLIDGIFPMIQVFFGQFYNDDTNKVCYLKEHGVVDKLVKSVMEFVKIIDTLSTNATQIKKLNSACNSLINNSLNRKDVEEFKAKQKARATDNKSEAQKNYIEEHENEETRNIGLNRFANNYMFCYTGENTVRAQLSDDLPKSKIGSAKREYDLGGIEKLPLGNEFQEHIRCFKDPKKKGTKEKNDEQTYGLAFKLVEQLLISCQNPKVGESEKEEQEALDIRCLQLLRAMIHNEERRLPENWKSDSKIHQGQLESIESIQNELDEHGAMLKILPLAGRTSVKLASELLVFISAMLFNGNQSVQSSLMKYFLDSKEEHFFMVVKNRINTSALELKEKRALLAQHRGKIEEENKEPSPLVSKQSRTSNGMFRSEYFKYPCCQNKVNDSECIQMIGTNKDEEEQNTRKMSKHGELQLKKDEHINVLLRILGGMCDGQHTDLQNYLRDQHNNSRIVNIVAETAKFLQIMYSNINDNNVELAIEVVITLNEFVSGNHENAMVLFNNNVIEYVNYILQDTMEKNNEKQKSFDQLRLVMAYLIMSIIEENVPGGSKLEDEVKGTIDKEQIYLMMLHYYCKEPHNELDTDIGFAYYHILMRLQDIENYFKRKSTSGNDIKSEEDNCNEWTFYADNSKSVELLKNGEVQKLHFRVKNTHALREEVKEKLKWNIKRESQGDKINDLVMWSDDIKSDIKYETKMLSYKPTKFFITLTPYWNWALLILSFAINVIILATWVAPDDHDVVKPQLTALHWKNVLLVLFVLHNVFSACLLISFFLSNRPRLPSAIRRLYGNKESNVRASYLETNFFSSTTLYYIMFFIFSIMGTMFYGYFFCFHLLHVVIMNQLLSRVLLAVTLNGKALLYVFLFGIIVIYIYSVISFALLRSHIYSTDGFFCATMFECFITTIRYGFLGILPEQLGVPPDEETFETLATRTIYDVSFYILIVLIGFNIIFGIIIDTFSELRDNKNRTENDMRTLCFICGRGNHEFDSLGNGFRKHVQFEHNLWSYLFFFIHLNDTRSNDYTAIELYVSNM